MPDQTREHVFVSYSHKDKEWLDKFRTILAPDIRNGRVDYWDDRELQPGDPWYERILDGIRTARVAVLLVSPNFLASRFIMEEELPRILSARDQGLTIVWVPLFGTFYGTDAPPQIKALTDIQAAFDAGTPLAAHDPSSQTSLLIDLSRHIERLLNPGRVPSNLPFNSLAELFKGRNEALAQLDRNLRQHGSAAIVQPQAIHGLGGIGKTRLALEYAWRHQDDFTAFLFVSANTPDDLDRNLAALSRPNCLDLRESQAPKQEDQRDAVDRWLQENKDWLLILDNVDTDEGARAVKALVAKLRGGHVIITSRVTEWGRGVRPIALNLLSLEDAVALLIESVRSWRAPRPEDPTEARTLAERLGCLPLALTHATAYMQHHHQSFSTYLDDFERRFERLLAYHDHLTIEYETQVSAEGEQPPTPETDAARKRFVKTVATTFFVSFERLTSEAKAILQAAAFLAPDPIPVAMFDECPDEVAALVDLWCEEASVTKSGQSVADAVAELARYSLVSRVDGAFSVHRMEQLVLRSRVVKERVPRWIERTRAVLWKYAPDEAAENPQTWPIWDALRPHAELLIALQRGNPGVPQHLGLLDAMSQLYFGKGLYKQSLEFDEASLPVAERLHGPESGEMAHRFICLGETLRVLGRFRDAEVAFRSSLAIRETNDGRDSLRVASDLNYLALALGNQGKAEDAERLQRRSLQIYEARLAEADKGDYSKTLNNLALLVEEKGVSPEVGDLKRRAVQMAEEGFGAGHPKTLICVVNLAITLARGGDRDGAAPLFERACTGFEKTLGMEHPTTLNAFTGYADFLRSAGKLEEAEAIYRRVLSTSERLHGLNHDETLTALNSIGWVLQAKGNPTEAATVFRKALDIRDRVSELEHPGTLIVVHNLAMAVKATGDLAEAERLFRRVVVSRDRVLGPNHSDTLESVCALVDLLDRLGNVTEAREWRDRLMEGLAKNGDLLSLRRLALQFYVKGEYGRAEELLQRVIAGQFEVPSNRCHLARLLVLTGREREAREQMTKAWQERSSGPSYVIPRILWFKLLFAILDYEDVTFALGCLKSSLQEEGAHSEWTMQPVLDHLKPRMAPELHALVAALVAALNDVKDLPALDALPIWRAARPEPLVSVDEGVR